VTKSLYILFLWQKNRGEKKVHPREKMRKKGYTKFVRQKNAREKRVKLACGYKYILCRWVRVVFGLHIYLIPFLYATFCDGNPRAGEHTRMSTHGFHAKPRISLDQRPHDRNPFT